jgi:hypothetical protein
VLLSKWQLKADQDSQYSVRYFVIVLRIDTQKAERISRFRLYMSRSQCHCRASTEADAEIDCAGVDIRGRNGDPFPVDERRAPGAEEESDCRAGRDKGLHLPSEKRLVQRSIAFFSSEVSGQ